MRAGQLPVALAGALLSVAPLTQPALHAQNVLLDEGVFTVFLAGREAGTETFSIRRVGTGTDARILANATVDLGRRQLRPLLEATPQLGLSRYEVTVSGEDATEVSLMSSGNRFVVLIRTALGEQEREFRARPGAILLEEQVAHQYYFAVALANQPGSGVVVVDPRHPEQPRLEVLEVSSETLRFGQRSLEAQRFLMSLGGIERTVWTDRNGRVLRVEVPSKSYRAERTGPPA